MFGLLTSLGIMTWIISGAQLAMFNNELKFTEKEVSVAGCPANTTIHNQTDYSGYDKCFIYNTDLVENKILTHN